MAPRKNQDSRVGKAIAAWLAFTYGGDTSLYGVFAIINWVVTGALGWAAYKCVQDFRGEGGPWLDRWQLIAIIAGAWVAHTIIRAALCAPRRAARLKHIYTQLTQPCGYPKGTAANPAPITSSLRVTSWSNALLGLSARPVKGRFAAPLKDPFDKYVIETKITESTKPSAEHVVIVGWDDDSTVGWIPFSVAAKDSLPGRQQQARQWVDSVISGAFPAKRGTTQPAGTITEWDEATPAQVVVGLGNYVGVTRAMRNAVTTSLEEQFGGVVWETTVEREQLVITALTPGTPEATQAALETKNREAIAGIVGKYFTRSAADALWADAQWSGQDPAPTSIVVTLGAADVSSDWARRQAIADIRAALAVDYPATVWDVEWDMGAHSSLLLTAHGKDSEHGRQIALEASLDTALTSKFTTPRGQRPVSLAVAEWDTQYPHAPGTPPVPQPDGYATAATCIQVTLGTIEAHEREQQRKVELYFDSITTGCDWSYAWDTQAGILTITAVPELPSYISFPEVGTPEHEEWHKNFRAGRIILGPQQGGGEAVIDLNKSPHILIGGTTGAGKSVLLSAMAYGILYNPDMCEGVVVDPKVTDFTWMARFANVAAYAVEDVRASSEEIYAVVHWAYEQMMDRQALLQAQGVVKISDLREAARQGKARDGLTLADVPKRLFVFFDEIGAALQPSGDAENKARINATRELLEQIAMLGRAMEVNIICAAQKPSQNNVGTALRAQLPNRVSVGYLGTNESIQVLESTMARDLLKKSDPKGRSVMSNDTGAENVFQCYYLPNYDQPNPVDSSIQLKGIQGRLDDRLTSLGHTKTTVDVTFHARDLATQQVKQTTVKVDAWEHPSCRKANIKKPNNADQSDPTTPANTPDTPPTPNSPKETPDQAVTGGDVITDANITDVFPTAGDTTQTQENTQECPMCGEKTPQLTTHGVCKKCAKTALAKYNAKSTWADLHNPANPVHVSKPLAATWAYDKNNVVITITRGEAKVAVVECTQRTILVSTRTKRAKGLEGSELLARTIAAAKATS